MFTTLLAIVLLPLIGFGLTLFPWPDLPSEMQSGITTIFAYFSAFDQVLPMHEAMTIFLIMASIDIAIWIYNFGSSIIGYFTGRQSPRIGGSVTPETPESWFRKGMQ